jgi:large repetitive protein
MKQLYALIIFSLIFTNIATAVSKFALPNSLESKITNEFNAKKAIKKTAASLDVVATGTKIYCNNPNSGKIYVTITGGTGPYTIYYYKGGVLSTSHTTTNTTDSLVNQTTGNYLVQVKDYTSTTKYDYVDISYDSPTILEPVTSSNITCKGANDGSIYVYVYGGESPYQFSVTSTSGTISNTTGDFQNLAPGSYTLTVSDNGGCNISYPSSIELTEPTLLTLSITSTTDAKGCDNGTVSLSASGGTTPYQEYSLNTTTSTTGTFSDVTPGSYTTMVTDKNGCTATAGTVTITQTVTPLTASFASTDVKCNGASSGSITITSSNGTPNYTYKLMNGATVVASSSGTTNTTYSFTGLAAGTYTASVTDANSCVVSKSITISEPTAALSVSLTKVDVTTCFGNANGSITATASGGTAAGNYNFTLSPNTGTTSRQSASVMKFTELTAQSYSVTVTDDNSCSTTKSITVATPTGTPLSVSVDTTYITCNGLSDGKVTLTGAGGNIGYTPATYYQYAYTTGSAPTAYGTTATFSDLAKGDYTAWVKDGNGCTASSTFTIDAPTVITVTATPTDVTGCNGNTNGSITAKATGGNGGYKYTLTPGAITNTTGTFSNLAAGSSYIVTVTDVKSCTAASTATTISQPAAITATASTTSTLCSGGATGTISVSATGGTTPLSYTLVELPSAVFASGKFSNIPAGTYTVHISDKNSCTKDITDVIVTDATAITLGTATVTNVKCYGGSTGEIAIAATGGTGTLSYTVSPIAGNAYSNGKFTGLPAGSYTITVTDSNGCSKTSSSITITQPASTLIVGTPTWTNVTTCYGDATGTISISASGSTSPYTFTLSSGTVKTGTTSTTFSNLSAGSYTVTVTDANSCETKTSSSVTITEPKAIILSLTETDSVKCYGGDDGQIKVTASNGTGSYTYSLSPGSIINTTGSFTGLAANSSYSVKVTDSNNCSQTLTNINVGEPQKLVLSASTYPALCSASDSTSITLTTTGGAPAYEYFVKESNTWTSVGSQSVFNNVPVGNYTFKVQDNHGCSDTILVSVAQPTNALSLSKIEQLNKAFSCYGDKSGSITLTPSGGTPSYFYSIDGGTTWSSDSLFSNLAAGSYKAAVKDANNCIYKDSSKLVFTEPSQISVTETTHTNVSVCATNKNGSVNLKISGGTAPYQSVSMANVKTYKNTILTPLTNGVSLSFTGLGIGKHIVTVADKNSCIKIDTVTITGPDSIKLTSFVASDVLCHGNANGSIIATATGGTGSLSYKLNNGTAQSSGNFSGLSGNTYTLTVTDANSCTLDSTVIITEPSSIAIASATSTDLLCSSATTSGTITVKVSGGTTPYSFTLLKNSTTVATNNTGLFTGLGTGDYTVSITDVNNCNPAVTSTLTISTPTQSLGFSFTTINGKCNGDKGEIKITPINVPSNATCEYSYDNGTNWTNNADSTGLIAGTYTLKVRIKGSSCETNSQTATLKDPTAISLTATSSAITSCYGSAEGSITASATGGTGSLKYAISDTINYPFQTSGTFTDLIGGSYTVWAKDDNNCKISISTTISQPVQISYTLAVQQIDATHTTGSISINNAKGGTGTLKYIASTDPTPDASAFSTTKTLYDNLTTGTYYVIVKDDNDCETRDTVLIYNSLKVTTDSANITCKGGNNGSITITPQDGTAPYTYTLTKGTSTLTQTSSSSYTFSNGLTAGTYTISVTDNSTPSKYFTKEITLTEPDSVTFKVVATDVSCNTSGTITVTDTLGGSGGYLYSINNGTYQTSNIFSNLPAGTYLITVKDKNDCISETKSVLISSSSTITLSTSVTSSDLNTTSPHTGAFSASASGGSSPYSYQVNGGSWSSSTNTAYSETALAAGNYIIIAKDNNGCLSVADTVNIPYAYNTLDVTVGYTTNKCYGDSSASISLTITNGKSNYTVVVKNSSGTTITASSSSTNTFLYDKLPSDIYTVNVKDASSPALVYYTTVTIPALTAVSISNVAVSSIVCHSDSVATVTVTATGGTALSYQLGTGTPQADGIFNNVALGSTYKVYVSDNYGCTDTTSVTVASRPSKLIITTTVNTSNMSITANVTSGGKTPYTYALGNGSFSTTNTWTSLSSGTYWIKAKDTNGCSDSVSVKLSSDLFVIVKDTVCGNSADGQFTVTPKGGVSPYSWTLYNITAGSNNSNMISSTKTFSGLAAGKYRFTLVDKNKKNLLDTTFTIYSVIVKVTAESDGNAKSITIHAKYGSKPYTYYLYSETSKTSINQIDSVFTNQAYGTYWAKASDYNGCTSDSVKVILSNKIYVEYILLKDTICSGANDGQVIIHPLNGKSTYTWTIMYNDGADEEITSAPFAERDSILNLVEGAFTFHITDSNGLMSSDTTINIYTKSLNVTAEGSSKDKTITVHANGGSAPYTYTIDGWNTSQTDSIFSNLKRDTTYTLQVQDSEGCKGSTTYKLGADWLAVTVKVVKDTICTGSTDGTIIITPTEGTAPYTYSLISKNDTLKGSFSIADTLQNLAAGSYILSVVDATTKLEFDTTIVIATYPAVSIKITEQQATCDGDTSGKLIASITGGTPKNNTEPYNYYWLIDGVAKKDTVLSGVPSGKFYKFIVEDKYCTTTDSFKIGSKYPPIFITQDSVLKSACNKPTGAAYTKVTGGTAPYTYKWTQAGSTSVLSDTTFIKDVDEGKYIFSITDSNGCSKDTTFTISSQNTIVISLDSLKASACINPTGAIYTKVTGGVSPYQYVWTQEDGTTLTSDTTFIENVTAGKYDIAVTDANSCSKDTTIEVLSLNKITFIVDQIQKSSCKGSDGAIYARAITGTYPFTYKWNDTNNTADSILLNVSSGKYTLTAVDKLGCSKDTTITLLSKSTLDSIRVVSTISTTCTGKNGAINIKVDSIQNSTLDYPLIYQWSHLGNVVKQDTTKVNTSFLKDVEGGNYRLSVTDSKGCSIDSLLTVPFTNNLTVSLNAYTISATDTALVVDSICIQTPLQIIAKANADVDKFTWLWLSTDVPNITARHTGTNADTLLTYSSDSVFQYHVRATLGSCTADSSIRVLIHPYPTLILTPEATIGKSDSYQFSPTIITNSKFDESTFSYKWTPSYSMLDNDAIENATFSYNSTSTYNYYTDFPFLLVVLYDTAHNCSVSANTIIHLAGDVDPQSSKLGNNALTPNGDGINDFWYIRNAEYYPSISVEVYNRWGEQIYKQTGYDNSSKVWKGTYNGNKLPSGTYYYIIKLNSHAKALTGTVTIIR